MKLTLIIIACHIICLFANHLRAGKYPNRIIKTKIAHKPVHGLVRKSAHKKHTTPIHCQTILNTHTSIKTTMHGLRSIKC